jgi:hypothetical protein
VDIHELPLLAARSALELDKRYLEDTPAELPYTREFTAMLSDRRENALSRGLRAEKVLFLTFCSNDRMKFVPGVRREDLDTAPAAFAQELSFLAERGFKVDRNEIAKLRDTIIGFSDLMSKELLRLCVARNT